MEGLIKWFSRNHVAGNFLMLGILIAGYTTWFQLRKEVMPEVSAETVSIRVIYPNATPEDVESGVVIPIEEAIAEIEGIEQISSTCSQGLGSVNVEIDTSYNLRNVMDDLKTEVDAIDNLAEEAEKPTITEVKISNSVMGIAITADTDEKTLRTLGERVRDDLLVYELPESSNPLEKFYDKLRPKQTITQVELAGVRPYEISIEVSETTLRELNLTIGEIAQKIRQASIDLPGGSVDTSAGEIILRAVSKRYTADEFKNIPIVTRADGSTVLLNEIAKINDGFEDVELINTFDGKPAVVVNINRVGSQDTLILSRMVKSYIEEKADSFPDGVDLTVWNDQSKLLQGRLDLLKRNAGVGILLVLVVLALFLRPTLALLVAIGIPVSFAGGIWMMPYMDVSINMISLFAFILVLGVVVDDAIVVGENVYTKIQEGMHPKEAAWKGSHEVGVIVIFGILTTALAFTPMLGIDGISGQFWRNIPLIVIPVLLFSLVQSKLVLPAHLALLSPTNNDEPKNPLIKLQKGISNGLQNFVRKVYSPALEVMLRWRWVVLSVFVLLLFVSVGLVGGNRIKFVFFPNVEGDLITCNLELAPGTPFKETEKAVDRINDALDQLATKYSIDDGDESVVKHILSSKGSKPMMSGFALGGIPTESNLGQVSVEMTPSRTRSVSVAELAREWRSLVGEIPGASELTFTFDTGGGGNAIDVNLVGPNLDQLKEATDKAKNELAQIQGTIDITDNDRPGKKELRFRELTPTGRALGFTLKDVADQVRWAFFGNEVQRIQRGKDDLKVMVRYPKAERLSVENMEQIRLRTSSGAEVPLLQVVTPKDGTGPSTIQRIDRQRSIKVSADVDAAIANSTDVQKKFFGEILPQILSDFPSVRFKEDGEVKDRNQSISQMSTGFLFAMVGMFVMMAIPLRSYIQPIIVMSVIPFGIVGAIFGHLIMGYDLSIMSLCGIVALAGVVVNDSLVLVEFVNRFVEKGGTVLEAARAAGAARFRAIILTSLTTFVGIMPMVLETDMQAQFLIPMAVSLGFGILFATLITLILVPSIYLILEDIKGLFRKAKNAMSNA